MRKEQRRLDTTMLEIHTDKFVGERCLERGGCDPIPVRVEEKVKSFIIKAATHCLEPNTYYTLDINHPMCDNIFCMPSFIRVEKCGLFQDPVKLVYTETTFPIWMFDGHPKCGIPKDPAFPDDGMTFADGVDGERSDNDIDGEKFHNDGRPIVTPEHFRRDRHEETRLIPVELDLHGNTAFGDNFVKGIGPHPKTLVLYYTNRGTFSVCRTWRRRTDY